MKHHVSSAGVARGSAIDRAFELRDECVNACFIGTGRTRWRHHAATQLANHLFPRFGILRHQIEVRRVEHQSGGLASLVVTGDAVLVDERT